MNLIFSDEIGVFTMNMFVCSAVFITAIKYNATMEPINQSNVVVFRWMSFIPAFKRLAGD